MGDLAANLKNFLYALLGIGAVGGLAYMTGAGTFPTDAPQVVPFPVNKELVDFYTAGCDVQVLTNQTRSLNNAQYLINASEMVGNPAAFVYANMTRSSTDWSRWSAGAFQNTTYYCYIHIVQNEPLGTTDYYFNFSRNPNTNLNGTATWAAGTYGGTYNYRSLTITGPVTLSGSTTLNVLENITVTGGGQISMASSSTLNISTYRFSNAGTIVGVSANILLTKTAFFDNSGTITLAGAAGSDAASCICTTSCSTPHCTNAGGAGTNGGNGGTFRVVDSNVRFNNTATGSIILNGGAGGAASSMAPCVSCGSTCLYPYYTIIVQQPAGNGGNAGAINLGDTYSFVNAGVITAYAGAGGTGGAGGIYCSNGASGTGTASMINSSNQTTITGNMIVSGTGGTWTINRCGNTTDDSKVSPAPTIGVLACLKAPTAAFVVPNSTTSLWTLSNNLSVILSGSSSGLLYRYQLSLNNGTNWTYITEASAVTPTFPNNTTTFDVYLMNSSPVAKMRVLTFNNTSNVFGEWVNSQEFYLWTRNTSLLNTTSPSPITSPPFTVTCNYTSNDTALQDAGVFVIIDGVSYTATYNMTTGLYSYTWPVSTSITAGSHTFSCLASKGNFNASRTANVTFSVGGFILFYAGGNGTRFYCPFPTYTGAYPAYQTAGKGAIRVQNLNTTANKNYTSYLRYPQPTGMIVYARCDKLSPSAAGWTILSDVSGYQCWTAINSTNTSAYMWLKGDCVGATAGTYNVPEIIVVEN